jgi:hypothetical protein
MRIALLSYRSKDHCGGQGVYVRHLSHGLVELGHDVEVFSGQPYPELLDPRVRLTKVPSLDLYREPDPFRVPRPSEIRDSIDLLELLTVWTAWWLKCAVGVSNAEHPGVAAYHRLLVWDLMRRPTVTRLAEALLNPLIGKSVVMYFSKYSTALQATESESALGYSVASV